ncbi:phosphoribosylformylglycinamidine synthase subunit PurS [Amphibacillus sp. MSJ-3]|uniref:phosphoribosylformylglycinamidine synthase subunit PurS n=1 Tax=Amphibacillus sp. MSJ-3 TaxID=2841505 RepID=UPI001C0E93B0|nr:phosphoribosylformylglycinamidine synthase subunit PurS [Amphibacillus sp. MSJ-3]MBU5593881.1 phosphoribosylformylglycinamidine synthase subunit PurS [Amphibacillus sp. MSJ-3]
MIKANVYIKLKKGVLDSQGKAVQELVNGSEIDHVENVRVGKLIELTFANRENINEQVEKLCQELLVNYEMEDYSYTIEECGDE